MDTKKKAAIYLRLASENHDINQAATKRLVKSAKKRGWEIQCILEDRLQKELKFKNSTEKRKFFREKSSNESSYKNFNKLKTLIQEKSTDIVLLEKLADLGNYESLISFINLVRKHKIEIIVLSETGLNFDTKKYSKTEFYSFLLKFFNIFNSYEKDYRSEQIKISLKELKKTGKKLGPTPRVTPSIIKQAEKMRVDGFSFIEIGKKFNFHESTIRKILVQTKKSSV